MSASEPASEPMRPVDHAWYRMEEPTNLMMITGVLLFDQPVELHRLREVIERRLLMIPRFRQRVEQVAGQRRRHWVEDDRFDLDRHLVRETLPAPGDEAALREVISRWMSTPLDYTRPLWQTHLLDNFGRGSAVMWRLHHCIGDGIALMLVLLSLTDLEASAESPPDTAATAGGGRNPLRHLFGDKPLSAETAKRHLEQVMPEAVKLLTGPVEALRSLSRWKRGGASVPAFGRLALRPPDPKSIFKGPLGPGKRAAWSDAVPLAEIQELRESLGGTVNDVLTAAVTGGLRRYLDDRGVNARGLRVRAVVPVNLRPLEEMASLGNQFGLVFLSLPVGLDDPLSRLAELRKRMGALKRSFEPVVALKVLAALGFSPYPIQRLVVKLFGAKGTAVMTNVPGPRQTLHLSGVPIRSFIFWVPQSGRLGMGISIASYAGEVRLGVATDEGLVADPERIIEGFHEELRLMRELASESAVPGR